MRALAAAAAAPVLGLMLAACGAPAPALNRARPPVSATPAPVPADPTTPPTAIQAWCSGPGFEDYQSVSNAMLQLRDDTSDGAMSAVPGDGSQLATDAGAAVGTPPPLTRAHRANYSFAMAFFSASGAMTAEGNITTATSDMEIADRDLGGLGALIATDCG